MKSVAWVLMGLVLCVAASEAQAQLAFRQMGSALGFSRPAGNPLPYDFVAADWNGDGWDDLYLISHGQALGCSLFRLNDRQGGFGDELYPALHRSMSNASQTGWRIAEADFDGDGAMDVWVGGWALNHLCFGDGTGTGWDCRRYGPTPVRIGDANGDGLLDAQTESFRWYINDGTRNYAGWPQVTNLFELDGPDVLDLNGDGYPDWVDVATDQVFMGLPGGTYAPQPLGIDVRAVDYEDVTGDGCLDLGIATGTYWYRSNKQWWAQIGCSGIFARAADTSLPYFPGVERVRVDLDNDGRDEIVVLQSTEWSHCTAGVCGPMHVYREGGGELTTGVSWVAAYYQTMVATDYDNDGRVDLAGVAGPAQAGTSQGVSLLRNETASGHHFVKVALPELATPFRQPAIIEARDVGTGAVVATTRARSGFHLPTKRYHLGIGTRSRVDLRVRFPDGTVTVVSGAAADGLHAVTKTETPPPADVEPPVVSLTSALLTAVASDDRGVASVEWLLDGASMGSASAPPYTVDLAISSLAPGAHTVTARARDRAGNTAEATLGWTVPASGAP